MSKEVEEEDLWCEYSGMPSPMAYNKIKDQDGEDFKIKPKDKNDDKVKEDYSKGNVVGILQVSKEG